MKRTMGFEADDVIFQSEAFNDFNEFTANVSAVKIFEYAKEIKDNCSEKQYPMAWEFALRGARKGLNDWEEDGASSLFEEYLDDGIITELYEFFFICNGVA